MFISVSKGIWELIDRLDHRCRHNCANGCSRATAAVIRFVGSSSSICLSRSYAESGFGLVGFSLNAHIICKKLSLLRPFVSGIPQNCILDEQHHSQATSTLFFFVQRLIFCKKLSKICSQKRIQRATVGW